MRPDIRKSAPQKADRARQDFHASDIPKRSQEESPNKNLTVIFYVGLISRPTFVSAALLERSSTSAKKHTKSLLETGFKDGKLFSARFARLFTRAGWFFSKPARAEDALLQNTL